MRNCFESRRAYTLKMMVTFCPYHFYIFLDRNLESLPTFKVDVYLYLAVSYLDFLKD